MLASSVKKGKAMSKTSSNRKVADEVIHFLDTNRLDPVPANYAFAFLYVTSGNSPLHKSVANITDGGVRLSQADVDTLMGQEASSSSSAMPPSLDGEYQALRHQALAFADLTTLALRDAGAFSRDLNEGVEQMSEGYDLTVIVRAMIEKTTAVERKLAETCRETEKLRLDLDAARDDASRDALTKLPNRRAMEQHIRSTFKEGSPITIAFFDIDHFKSINDRFGHAVGDRVLKAVAESLAETLTPHIVARFGGEEFVALFSEPSQDAVYDLVEKARIAVSEKHFKVRETDAPLGQVTFSAGIATTRTDPDQALQEADQALYEAKNNGRNQTVVRALSRAS
jgi:diguanylate cyclase